MTTEATIVTLLQGLCSRVYPDVAPAGTARPYVTYQQVGGRALTFMERTAPSKKHGRFQISVWADTRIAAAALALQIENAFITASTMQAEPLSAPVSDYEPDTKLYGARQDFTVWSDR